MKETSKFYSSLGLLIFLNAIIKPLWIFGVDRLVQNSVGTVEYGNYFSLFNLSIVFSFLLDLGLTNYFNRQLAAQKENFIDHVGNFLLIKLLFLILYILVVCMVAWITGINRWDIIFGVIFIQAFQSLFVFFRAVITAHQWFRTEAWLSVLDKTLMILLCGSLLYIPSLFGVMTIDRFLSVQVICTAIAMSCAFIILLRRKIHFSFSKISTLDKEILKSGVPFIIIMLLMSVHFRLDGFLLERIHANGAHEAGIYAAAYRLLDAANMIGVLLASLMLPYIARQWSQKNNVNDIVLTSRHFLMMFSITVACAAFFLAPWIEKILYHHDDSNAIQVMQWCLPALIGYSLVQIYGTFLIAIGQVVSFCYITFIAVLINTSLNLLLIPSLGARGSCFAALASQGFCGIAVMWYSWRKTETNIHFRSLIIYVLVAIILSGFFYWGNNLKINPIWLIAGAAMISLTIMIATKLFQLKKWIDSFRRSEELS